MSELRQNFFTKEWVIIATDRAKRPDQMVVHRERRSMPAFSPTCPFCPGNEKQTPPEVLRLPTADPWTIRVVPNKFSALGRDLSPYRTIHRSRRAIEGFGVHDVLVETPARLQDPLR
jgi:UDPglucose--hexose-1-phosphate uridylyltransferase